MNTYFLQFLFVVNLLGTIYGYYWYGNQLIYTVEEMNPLLVIFVPDSPTASLFFTLTLIYLLQDVKHSIPKAHRPALSLRSWIEAFAVITSFKYGIWAVWMILAGAYQGDALTWQDWMLIGSHLGMAAEVILFSPFLTYGVGSVLIVAAWTLLNDVADYAFGVFPWLPRVLHDDLPVIQTITTGLSLVSIMLAFYFIQIRKRNQV